MTWRRASTAGGFAQRRYRLLRSRYRRRILPRLALLVLPVATASLAISFASTGMASQLGSVTFGASVMMFIALWNTAPAHVENWATGASGERATARALRRLERTGWQVSHDLDLPGAGNVDHLAVGTGGIFVLDSKAWGGVVRVDHLGVTVSSHDDPDATWTPGGLHRRHRRLQEASARAARALAANTGMAVPAPRPVVVLWAPFPQRVVVHRGITYVAGEHLSDWLISQPRQLVRRQLTALTAAASNPALLGTPNDSASTPTVITLGSSARWRLPRG